MTQGGWGQSVLGLPNLSFSQPSVDARATAGKIANAYQGMGDAAIANALGAANQGFGYVNDALGAARDASGQVGMGVSQMNQFAGEAAQAAGGMSGAIASVNQAAGSLTPYAGQLGGLGLGLAGQGSGWLNYGNAIAAGDDSAGGIVGQLIRAVSSIDPRQYASMASADVQGALKGMFDEMRRDLSRSGVDVGSGRYAAMLQRFASQGAASLAGAKTRAAVQGRQDQLAALSNALGIAGNMAGQGAQMQQAGGGLLAQGANVTAQQGNLYQAAGQLGASQANPYPAAGQLTQGAANLALDSARAQIQAAGLGVQAAGQLAGVGMNAANLYYQNAQGYGQGAGLYNLIMAM
jgi:putative membrane protein